MRLTLKATMHESARSRDIACEGACCARQRASAHVWSRGRSRARPRVRQRLRPCAHKCAHLRPRALPVAVRVTVNRAAVALLRTQAVVPSYAHKDAVAAAHRQYALSLARRTRSDEHMQCPLSAGRIRSRTDTLSLERADTCVAALNVGRTVTHAVATGSARGQDRALLHVRRRERCRTRGLAREHVRATSRAEARNARHRIRCLTCVWTHTRSLSGRTHCSLRRPAMTAHAACAQLQSFPHAPLST